MGHNAANARQVWASCALALLLAGCSAPQAIQLTPAPASSLLPLADVTSQPLAATVTSPGAGLSGRLLLVRSGAVWLWEGEQGRQIIGGGDPLAQPTWAPDGAALAAVQREQSFSNIVLAPAAGGELRPLTVNGTSEPPDSVARVYASIWAAYPQFVPDGSAVVFISQSDPPLGDPPAERNLGLYRVTASGGQRELLWASDTANVGRPAVSPDGASVVFAAAPLNPGEPDRLLRYPMSGGDAAPIDGVPEQSYDPTFSPDGRLLAFASRSSDRTDIFAMAAGGGQLIRLTDSGMARAPAFSPDGKHLAFLAVAPGESSFDLYIIDFGADGVTPAQTRRITTGMSFDADSGVSWGK